MKTYVITLSKTFPAYHPRRGQETDFLLRILNKSKKHTIRENYTFWKNRLLEVNAGRGVLSLRQWVGKPYGRGSTQEEFMQLTSVGYQVFEFKHDGECMAPYVDGKKVNVDDFVDVHENDGLSNADFMAWFKYPKPFKGILIHFTDLRY